MPCSNGPDAEALPLPGARLVPMREAHVEQIVAIEEASFASPWRREHFLYEISENRWAANLVVEVSGEVLAYACVWVLEDELKINNIAVRDDQRRRGIGDWLLTRVLERARRRGSTLACLEVRPSNLAAVQLYREHGFREVGRRVGYYQQEREDALLMELAL